MLSNLHIRQESVHDYAEVYELNRLAFEQDGEAKLVDALRKNSDVFIPELSIVAVMNNAIVGHILFTKIKIQEEQGATYESLALAPMAVLPEFQKQGIGTQLVQNGLNMAKQLNYPSVIVLGHNHYYPKFGFEPAAKWNIKAPFNVPSHFFMALELKLDSLKNISGTVIYPKEFEGV
ncbi:MAG: N-acetyltransferase [Cytophagaceae bacterium]